MEEERIYRSIADMRRRKRQLRHEIAVSEKMITHSWHELFHRHGKRRPASRTVRIGNVVSTGVSVVDGALLVWKLYRRFKK